MKWQNHPTWSAALALAALLTACGPRDNEGALELECRGSEVVDDLPATRPVSRIYRFDERAAALQIWDSRAHRFETWGTGTVSIDRRSAAFAGDAPMEQNILVRREIDFDRSTRKIRDRVHAAYGSVAEFRGICEEQ